MSKRALLGSISLVSILCGARAAIAQEQPASAPAASPEASAAAPSSATAQLGQEDNGEILVTARRVAENLQKIPVAVTALSGDTLRNMSIKELKDLASVSPGLVIKNSSNDSNSALVALRGQWPSGILISLDSSVGLYVDGFNNPRSQGFRSATVDVKRVEVLRGPQGTLYGRNTTGGAISVTTNSPTDKFEGSLQGDVGNLDTYNAIGIVNIPITEGLATRFVVQHGHSSGYARDSQGRELGNEKSTYLRGKTRLESGALTAELYVDYSNFKNGGPVSRTSGLTAYTTPIGALATREVAQELGFTQDPAGWAKALAALQPYVYSLHGNNDGRSAFDNQGNGQFYRFRGWSTGLDTKLELSSTFSLRSLTAYRHFFRLNQVDFDGTPFDILDIRFRGKDDFFSQELQLIGDLGRVNFVAGGFYSYENGLDSNAARSTAAIAIAAGRPPFDTQGAFVTNKSIAAYAQANWKITDSLTLTTGARYTKDIRKAVLIRNNNQDYLTLALPIGVTAGCELPAEIIDAPDRCRATLSKSFAKPSWLASLDYKATNNILVYAKVARGYRTGGQNIRATTLASIKPFDPETITEYEIGFKSELFDHLLRLNVAAFHDNYNNVQRVTAIVVGGVTSAPISNAATAKIDGVEVEATLRPMRGVTLGANIAYTNARYKKFIDATGDRSNEDWPTPDWTYSLMARYETEIARGVLALQADVQGQSRQNLYPAAARQQIDVTQPGYALLNGRISYRLPSGLEFAVYGRNLLNKTYADAGLANEGLGINLITIAPPRTYGVEVRYAF